MVAAGRFLPVSQTRLGSVYAGAGAFFSPAEIAEARAMRADRYTFASIAGRFGITTLQARDMVLAGSGCLPAPADLVEYLRAQVAALQAENAYLKRAAARGINDAERIELLALRLQVVMAKAEASAAHSMARRGMTSPARRAPKPPEYYRAVRDRALAKLERLVER